MGNELNKIKNKTILVIEDEENIRASLVKILSFFCDNVLDSPDGEDGYNKLKNNHIDIILSDIQLPKISGIDFISKIRGDGYKTPVIMLTAYTNQEYISKALELKLVDYLIKPIDLDKLKTSLVRALDFVTNEVVLNENFVYSEEEKIVKINDEIIKLTNNEIALLELLIKNKKQFTTQYDIEYHVWKDEIVSDSAFKSLINKLRKKIGKDTIINRSGVGYILNI